MPKQDKLVSVVEGDEKLAASGDEVNQLISEVTDKPGFMALYKVARDFSKRHKEITRTFERTAVNWRELVPSMKKMVTDVQGKLVRSKIEDEVKLDAHENDMRTAWGEFFKELNVSMEQITQLVASVSDPRTTIPEKAINIDNVLAALPRLIRRFDELDLDVLLGNDNPEGVDLSQRLMDLAKQHLFPQLDSILAHVKKWILKEAEAIENFKALSPEKQQLALVGLQSVNYVIKHVYLIFDKLEIRFPCKEGFFANESILTIEKSEKKPDQAAEEKSDQKPELISYSLNDLTHKLSQVYTVCMNHTGATVDTDLLAPYTSEIQAQRTAMCKRLNDKVSEDIHRKMNATLAVEMAACLEPIEKHLAILENELAGKSLSKLRYPNKHQKYEILKKLKNDLQDPSRAGMPVLDRLIINLKLIETCVETLEKAKRYSGRTAEVLDGLEGVFYKTKQAVAHFAAEERHKIRIEKLIQQTESVHARMDVAVLYSQNSHGSVAIAFQDVLRRIALEPNFTHVELLRYLNPPAKGVLESVMTPLRHDPLHLGINGKAGDWLQPMDDIGGVLTNVKAAFDHIVAKFPQDKVALNAVDLAIQESKNLLPKMQAFSSDALAPPSTRAQIWFYIKNIFSVFRAVSAAPKALSAMLIAAKEQSLEELQTVNQVMQKLALMFDKLEIHYNLNEGFIAGLPLINGLSLSTLAENFNAVLRDKLNSQFKCEERYPYYHAKKEQRLAMLANTTLGLTTAILEKRIAAAQKGIDEQPKAMLAERRDILTIIDARLFAMKSKRQERLYFRKLSRKEALESEIQWLIKVRAVMMQSGYRIADAVSELKGKEDHLYTANITRLLSFHRQIQKQEDLSDAFKQEKKIIDKLSPPIADVKPIKSVLLASVETKIRDLTSGFFSSSIQKRKAYLLTQFKKHLAISNFQNAVDTIRKDNFDYYLLFEGRTGLIVKRFELSALSREEMIARVEVEVGRKHLPSDSDRDMALQMLKTALEQKTDLTEVGKRLLIKKVKCLFADYQEWNSLQGVASSAAMAI